MTIPLDKEDPPIGPTFAARLNRLFGVVHPPGRGPYASCELIHALDASGVSLSAAYLSQLRSGVRTNPSAATMAAIAGFFRVEPDFFTDDEYYARLDSELSWLADARDDGVRRLAIRTVGLSQQSQIDLARTADDLRRRENLYPMGPDYRPRRAHITAASRRAR